MADSKTLFWLFFKLTGRVGRAAYFLGFLLLMIAVSFPLYQFMRFPEETQAAQAWSLVFGIVLLAALWSHVAMTVKRFHDLGRTGFMSLSLFIPVISIIAFIYLCVTPGTTGPNMYGRLADSPD